MNPLKEIQESGIVAVIRKTNVETIIPLARALCEGGVRTLEITVETPGALKVIEKLANELEDAVIGAGTVLDPETARAAIMAGAQFIFSPTVNTDTIKIAKRYNVVNVAGAMTPTEILTAFEHGSDIIKVFPANVLGPEYLKAVHGPLPQIPLMPTGGIDVDNTASYIKAGAVAVGVGSTLVDASKPVDEAYCQALTAKAKQFVSCVQTARAGS